MCKCYRCGFIIHGYLRSYHLCWNFFTMQAKHQSLRNTFQRHYIYAASRNWGREVWDLFLLVAIRFYVSRRKREDSSMCLVGLKVHTIYSYNTFKVKKGSANPLLTLAYLNSFPAMGSPNPASFAQVSPLLCMKWETDSVLHSVRKLRSRSTMWFIGSLRILFVWVPVFLKAVSYSQSQEAPNMSWVDPQ